MRKHIFNQCKVKNIIIDKQYVQSDSFDGIQILPTETALQLSDALPIVIFSSIAEHIAHKIRQHNKMYTDIVICAM